MRDPTGLATAYRAAFRGDGTGRTTQYNGRSGDGSVRNDTLFVGLLIHRLGVRIPGAHHPEAPAHAGVSAVSVLECQGRIRPTYAVATRDTV